jgi:hypothetical protein
VRFVGRKVGAVRLSVDSTHADLVLMCPVAVVVLLLCAISLHPCAGNTRGFCKPSCVHKSTSCVGPYPAAGFDAVPCGMRDTCSRVLLSLMRHSSSCTTSAATSSKLTASDSTHAAGVASASTGTPQQGGKLARSQRHSRSCSHLPDAVGTVGGFSWVSSSCADGASADQESADDAVGAAASVELMLTQPRDPLRRRQDGRWGRRRIVANGEQQGREKRE